jgi:arginyl-tRNA synthetase
MATLQLTNEQLAALGIAWGMFIGSLIGCSLRLRYDEINANTFHKDSLEDDLISLVSENMEKDKEIERLKKEVDALKCDEAANERLIANLKEELKTVMSEMYKLDIKLDKVESENDYYTRKIEQIQNTVFGTPIRTSPELTQPPTNVRKRHRTLSHESDDTH